MSEQLFQDCYAGTSEPAALRLQGMEHIATPRRPTSAYVTFMFCCLTLVHWFGSSIWFVDLVYGFGSLIFWFIDLVHWFGSLIFWFIDLVYWFGSWWYSGLFGLLTWLIDSGSLIWFIDLVLWSSDSLIWFVDLVHWFRFCDLCLQVAEWTKQISVKWRELTVEQKEQFQKMAATDKARYTQQVRQFCLS